MTDNLMTTIMRRQHDAEKMFAAAAFLRPDVALEDCGWLDPKSILDERVRKFWTELRTTGDTTQAALAVGYDYLGELATDNAVFYGQGVRQYAERIAFEQWFVMVGSRLAILAAAIMDNDHIKAQSVLSEMAGSMPDTNESIPTAVDVGLEFIQSLGDNNRTIKTGIPKLDRATGGLWRSTQTILCSRPSVGKTALGWQIARNIAATGNKVIFISLEMARKALWARANCGITRIVYRDILAKSITPEQDKRITDANNDLMELYADRLMIDDKTPQTTQDLWRKVASIKPDLVVVDHIRLFSDKGDKEVKRLGDITWNLKRIAKEFDLCVLALAQLNRLVEQRQEKHPTMVDLRDSGEIEENADVILGLHRDKIYIEQPKEITPAELVVMKFRDGPANQLIKLSFDGVAQWFEEAQR